MNRGLVIMHNYLLANVKTNDSSNGFQKYSVNKGKSEIP